MRSVGLVSAVIVALLTYELCNEIASFTFWPTLAPHDCAFEAQSQGHRYSVLEGGSERLRVFVVVELGQESKGTHGK